MKTKNAGKYNKRISIFSVTETKDDCGFPIKNRTCVLKTWASVKTLRGMTIIANNSDFEKAFVNFTIRFPKVKITRDYQIDYHGKIFSIEYLNNINGDFVELEIQAKEVEH
jgi:SPP1 family predicted phage head-tail adaptor